MGLEEADKMKGEDPCWDNYEMIGTKPGKDGRPVPNCVLKKPKKAKPKNEEVEIAEAKVGDTVSFHHELKSAPGSKVKKSGTVEKVDVDVVHVKVKDKYGVKRHQIKMGDLVKEDTELEEASRSLPSHLQKLIKDKNLDKKPMTMVTPSQKEKLKATVKDVTPKGYGPNEEVELEEATSVSVTVQATAPADKKYAVTEIHPRKSPRGRTRWKDVSYHSSAEEAKTAADAHAKKNNLHRMKSVVSEEVEILDELNKDTLYSYNKKADADIEKKHKSLGQLMRKGDAAGANKAAHQLNKRVAGMERAEKRLNTEEVEQIDEISAEVKQKYLAAATKKHLQQFLGRAPVRDKQELDKRRAAIQKTSKELTGKTHYQEEVEVEENFANDFLAMAKNRNPNARISTADQRKKEAEELAKKRAGLKPTHAAPSGNPRPLGGHDPKSGRSYSEEVEIAEEAPPIQVRASYTQAYAKHHKTGKKPSDAVAAAYEDVAKKHGYDMVKKLKAHHASNEQVETAAQVTKHFEKGQSTPSGVPKWVATDLKDIKKKKKVAEASDAELMGGAVSKPTASGNNPKLADKFMKAFRKMKSPANISCKTVGMISTCEDTEQEFNNMFTEAMKKKPEASSKQTLKKGEKLSGKQEPVTISPEIEKKGVA